MIGIIVSLFISLFTLPSALPQIYRWTDKNGTMHFSDNPSSLPEDYSMGKGRGAEKKEAKNKSSSLDVKSKSEMNPGASSEKSQLDKKAMLSPEIPKPAEKMDQPPPQPVEPTKPPTQDKVIVQIKPGQDNVVKQAPPGRPAATPGNIEPGKGPVTPPSAPGGPANRIRMKATMKVGAFVGILGIVLSAVGGIWFLIAAFKVSVTWGLLCLFLAPAQIVFLFKHWKEARKPFAVGLLAMGVILVAIFLMVEEPLLLLSQYSQLK
jgi:hypothetical protein